MSMRARRGLWPAILLTAAVALFMRGRPHTAAQPPASPLNPSSPVASPEPHRVRHAHHEDARQLHLRVVGVHDGDTLTGLDDSKTQYKVRLDAIDAPELGQPFGQAAKKALSEKVFGREVVVTVKARDKYGRTVGHVLVDGRDVNLEMLEEGMAWHYKKYDSNKRLQRAEDEARAARRGLWSDQDSIPPSEWRKEHHNRTERSAAQ